MNQITLPNFKKQTHHKPVKLTWISADKKVTRQYNLAKFYSNKTGDQIIMPKFIISAENKFFQISEKVFMALSEFGKTVFVVSG